MPVIFVGSKNPTKIFSVQKGYKEYHPDDLYTVATYSVNEDGTLGSLIRILEQPGEGVVPTDTQQHHFVIGIEVGSDVSDQPFSAKETLTGARNRANNLRTIINKTPTETLFTILNTKPTDKFFFVGVEGGIEQVEDKWLESGYIVVYNENGIECVGTSARFELAQFVIDELNTGKELCEVVDRLSGLSDVRSTQGYMGMITNTLLDRTRAYKHGVLFAFSRFESSPVYWDE